MLTQAYEPWFEQNHGPEPTLVWLEELQYMTHSQMLRAWEDCKTIYPGKAPTAFEFKALIDGWNPKDKKNPGWLHKSAAHIGIKDPKHPINDPNSNEYQPNIGIKAIQSDENVSRNKQRGNEAFDNLKAMMRGKVL